MGNGPKTFESSELNSNCDCNLSLNRSSDSYFNCSLSRTRIRCSLSNREWLVSHL